MYKKLIIAMLALIAFVPFTGQLTATPIAANPTVTDQKTDDLAWWRGGWRGGYGGWRGYGGGYYGGYRNFYTPYYRPYYYYPYYYNSYYW